MVDEDDNIVQHCKNECYKSYTMAKSLKNIAKENDRYENNKVEADLSEHLSSVEYCPKRR